MANPDHVEIVKRGPAATIEWRRANPSERLDLSGASLLDMDLRGADLRGAFMRGASLFCVDFGTADLSGADLQRARLFFVNFGGTALYGADFSSSSLYFVHFSAHSVGRAPTGEIGNPLDGAKFHFAQFNEVAMFCVDFSLAEGLGTVSHNGPSEIGIDALLRAKGTIPPNFLRGCGMPEGVIEYLPSLVSRAIEFYSCFISYSTPERSFARRLHDSLQREGIRCWLDEKEILPGDDIRDAIAEGIRMWDKVLFCASEASLTSWWVSREIKSAFVKEEKLSKQAGRDVRVLIPLNVDGFMFNPRCKHEWSEEIRARHAPDFTGWEGDSMKFEQAFERVVRALRSDEGARKKPPDPKLG